MLPSAALFLILWALPTALAGSEAGAQTPLGRSMPRPGSQAAPEQRPRIAIVGAGIAGASAAFHLHESFLSNQRPRVTIFEAAPRVGGRVRSVSPAHNAADVAEAGATHFFADDWCLVAAASDTGLKHTKPILVDGGGLAADMAVWDGRHMTAVPACNAVAWSWADLYTSAARCSFCPVPVRYAVHAVSQTLSTFTALVRRSGFSFWRFRQAARSLQSSWAWFGRYQTFGSISQELDAIGLGAATASPAEDFLDAQGISPYFRSAYVQPCARALFSQNLANLSAFSAVVAGHRATPLAIRGGNAQLVERMIRLSYADLRLNRRVLDISPGLHRRYKLTISRLDEDDYELDAELDEFDAVIVAGPWTGQSVGGLEPRESPLAALSSSRPRTESHVTLFSTRSPISPSTFGLSSTDRVRNVVLTTTSAPTSLGDPAFYSLARESTVYMDRTGCMSDDDCDQMIYEYIHRLHSVHNQSDDDLARLVGHTIDEGKNLRDVGITWVHRESWTHGAHAKNRTLPDEILIAPNLFYLGGAEDALETMEMSCRMGRNAAKTIWYHR